MTCAITVFACADNRDLQVYIASGSSSAYRYHARANCPSLSRSTVAETSLGDATQQGYTACARCHPPEPDFDVTATPRPIVESGVSDSTYTQRSIYELPSSSTVRSSAGNSESKGGKAKSSTESFRFSIPLALGSIVILIMAVIIRSTILERKAQKSREHQQQEERKQWEQDRSKYLHQFGAFSTLELSKAPKNCYVGEDGLPACNIGESKWGDGYTVYMTGRGKAYHCPSCRVFNSNNAFPVNVYHAKTGCRRYHGEHSYYACSYCHPSLPDLTWYEKYLEIRRIRKKYEIPEPTIQEKNTESQSKRDLSELRAFETVCFSDDS